MARPSARSSTQRPGPPSGRADHHSKAPTKRELLATLQKYEKAAERLRRGDGWMNAITGLGITGKDWTKSTTIETDDVLTRQQCDDLYAQDNLAASIVDTMADDAIRNWFEITGSTGEQEVDFQRKIFREFRRLRVKQRFLEWMKKGRKDGGGLLLIGADDGRALDQPLDFETVTEIRHLHFIERWTAVADSIDNDPRSDTFGEPLFYQLLPRPIQQSQFRSVAQVTGATETVLVHSSRVVAYEGVQVSETKRRQARGWGYSVLQRPFWSIQNYRVLWGHISTLFKHVAQTVVKFAGFAELNAADFQAAIQARLQQLQLARSTMNIVPLDAEDSLEEQTLKGLNGALEIFQYAQEELAQAANMPLTKLFGHMPQGFSKDDDAGRDNWNARVRGAQEDHLLEPLMDLVELVARARHIRPPKDWEINFLPVDVPSAKDAAEIDLKEAQADDIRIKGGVVDPAEARESIRVDVRCRYVLQAGEAKGEAAAHTLEAKKLESTEKLADKNAASAEKLAAAQPAATQPAPTGKPPEGKE